LDSFLITLLTFSGKRQRDNQSQFCASTQAEEIENIKPKIHMYILMYYYARKFIRTASLIMLSLLLQKIKLLVKIKITILPASPLRPKEKSKIERKNTLNAGE